MSPAEVEAFPPIRYGNTRESMCVTVALMDETAARFALPNVSTEPSPSYPTDM